MRAKQSFTASGIQSCFGVITPYITSHAALTRPRTRAVRRGRAALHGNVSVLESDRSQSAASSTSGEGLLHDARNLVGTIGLYCDLLSVPGVLKPEHRQYPEELRLLGARSKSLIDHLMQSLFALDGTAAIPIGAPGADGAGSCSNGGMQDIEAGGGRRDTVKPVSLRSVVERCSGLLSRVTDGRAIEITYGPAAAVPVRVREEVVERILVNLVRNAASAMRAQPSVGDQSVPEAADKEQVAIRILVGPLVSSVGEHRPWPFQRVRLVVEDAGRGMNPQQLERLLGGMSARSRGGHGIGFGVVRDLVAASGGEIRVMSEPEVGTCVQVEWPIVAMPEAENATSEMTVTLQQFVSTRRISIPAKSNSVLSQRLNNFLMNEPIEVVH